MQARTGTTGNRAQVNSALRAIPRLVEASHVGDRDKVMDIASEIGALLTVELPSVSERIEKMKSRSSGFKGVKAVRPEGLLDYASVEGGFETVILADDVLAEVRDLVAEHLRIEELAAFDTAPRHKVMLHGPPGNGKTMLARALAAELGIPLFEVRFGGVIGSFLGESGKNLQSVFDYVRTMPCVLFMDEVDMVGANRVSANDTGESRRIVNQLLLLIDRMPPTTVLVGATNLHDSMDSALMRRFDLTLEIAAPTPALARRCAEMELDASKTPGYDVVHLAGPLSNSGLPHLSAVVHACRWIRRDLCLNAGAGIDDFLAKLDPTY